MYQVLRIPNSDEEVRVKDPDVKQALLQAFKEVNSPEFESGLPVLEKKEEIKPPSSCLKTARVFYSMKHIIIIDSLINIACFTLVIVPASIVKEWDAVTALKYQEYLFRFFLVIIPFKSLFFILQGFYTAFQSVSIFGTVSALAFMLQISGLIFLLLIWGLRAILLPFMVWFKDMANLAVAYFTVEKPMLKEIRKFFNLQS